MIAIDGLSCLANVQGPQNQRASIGSGKKVTALHIAALHRNLEGISALADHLNIDIAEMVLSPIIVG